jgi:hypothetical protein
MAMPTRLRKFALTTHVAASVGWLGAVAAFLALAVAGFTSDDAVVVQAAYVAVELMAWFIVLPFAFAALLTGFFIGLGTNWGLVRHHWVVAKLAIAVTATILLLALVPTLGVMAGAAAEAPLARGDHRDLRARLVASAAVILGGLLAATALGVYKPKGLTAYGKRKQREAREARKR